MAKSRRSQSDPKDLARRVVETLKRVYPEATCALVHADPYQLLVATILSAQCTDRQVNKVTAVLFTKFNKPEDFAALTPEELEPYIKSCGFYHTKAKNIVLTSRAILEKHGGQVPENMQELSALPGVGRKTSNVVLSNAFGQDAIAVDTHVFRVTNRIGLANAKTVEETERQLMKTIPQEKWSRAHHWLIRHGRVICHARKPECEICPIRPWCGYYAKLTKPAKPTKQA